MASLSQFSFMQATEKRGARRAAAASAIHVGSASAVKEAERGRTNELSITEEDRDRVPFSPRQRTVIYVDIGAFNEQIWGLVAAWHHNCCCQLVASVTPEFPIAALRVAATAIVPQQADSDRFAAKIGIDRWLGRALRGAPNPEL